MKCNLCDVGLDIKNWYPSFQKNHRYTCISCHNKRVSKYQKSERGKISHKSADKKYRDNHKEKIKLKDLKWLKTKSGKESYKKRQLRYFQSQKGRRKKSELKSKRRNLGHIPLNEYFVGCEPHHIDKKYIIHIPKELNHIVYHSVFTGKNMDIINTYAYFFLLQQNINELNKIISGDE